MTVLLLGIDHIDGSDDNIYDSFYTQEIWLFFCWVTRESQGRISFTPDNADARH